MDGEGEQKKETMNKLFDQVKASRLNENKKSYDSVSNSVQSSQGLFSNAYETYSRVDGRAQKVYNQLKDPQLFKKSNKSSYQFENVRNSEQLSKKSRQSKDQIQYYNYELISSRPNYQFFQSKYQDEDQEFGMNSYGQISNTDYVEQQPYQKQTCQQSLFQKGSGFGSIYCQEKRNSTRNQKTKSSFFNRPIEFKNQKLSESNQFRSHPHFMENCSNMYETGHVNHSPFISEDQQFIIKKSTKRRASNFERQMNKNNYGQMQDFDKYGEDKSHNLSVNNGKDSTLAQTQMPNSMSNRSQIQKTSQMIYPSFLKGIDFSESDSPQTVNKNSYETDLFEFIKKEMIRISAENVNQEEEYNKIKHQYDSKELNYIREYKQYSSVKQQTKHQVERETQSIQQINGQIKCLEQQLKFYRQHFLSMQTSIRTKLKIQQDYYYEHKLKLEDTIMKNNQTILQCNNQLKNIKNQQVMKPNSTSLAFTIQENRRLKEELEIEKQLFIRRYKKLQNQDNQLQRLNRAKQKQYKDLYLQLQKAKKMVFGLTKT